MVSSKSYLRQTQSFSINSSSRCYKEAQDNSSYITQQWCSSIINNSLAASKDSSPHYCSSQQQPLNPRAESSRHLAVNTNK